MEILICLCIGYACGCISTSYIVGKANNIDIREHGSGNAGTTNALRTLGVKAGAITFFGDAFKALIPILIIRFFLFQNSAIEPQLLSLYTGLGVILGHNYPFWLNFKGGKGIAATGGALLAFDWRVTLVAIVAFVIITAITRYVSLGSLAVSIIFPMGVLLFYRSNPQFIHMLIVSCLFTVSAFYKHKDNIKRLLNGTENKLGQKVDVK
ncbi:glycerol-3-phosphate 1-O-acyltransferase PlsY [Anaerosporobacter sp.]|uniref:glycerol-3-phosphate 1-O-acyltransferase PlsY n=1 Tax=Anaerosporobacter sp. TaxID=1872529 RepID=UPI00286EC015|nr:glycerol-3-phosphate 1-O-acyltransferase PlsY [Anaerosporobacter sp.]